MISKSESSFEDTLLEYLEQTELGSLDTDALDQFCRRHPEHASMLKEFIASEQQVLAMAGPTVADSRATLASVDTSKVFLREQETHPQAFLDQNTPSIPNPFGRYQLLRELGQGAMGSVYLAFDSKLEREVALKVPKFHPERTTELPARFEREAKAVAGLRHRNLCPVMDVDSIEGLPFLSMAYIEGVSMEHAIADVGSFESSVIIDWISKVADALDTVHQAGIVHRDLKPSNIMIDTAGEPVLMDFGLAFHLDQNAESRITQDGAIVGTPAYMSPEQIDSTIAEVGPPSDVYSLGVILYQLLTGRVPFQGGISDLVHQAILKPPAPPSSLNAKIDPKLERICLKMLAKEPSGRYQSMSELIADLRVADEQSAPVPLGRRRFRKFFWTSVVMVPIMILFALSSILKVTTPRGEIIVEVPAGVNDFVIELYQDGQRVHIVDAEAGWVIEASAGEYQLKLNDTTDRFVLSENSLVVKRDETHRLRISQRANAKETEPSVTAENAADEAGSTNETPVARKQGSAESPPVESNTSIASSEQTVQPPVEAPLPKPILKRLPELAKLPGIIDVVSLSPDDRYVVAAGWLKRNDAFVWRYDQKTRQAKSARLQHGTVGHTIAWIDDRKFAVGRSDGSANLFSIDLELIDRIKILPKSHIDLATDQGGARLAISSSDATVAVVALDEASEFPTMQKPFRKPARAMTFATSEYGDRILLVGAETELVSWNLRNQDTKTIYRANGTIRSLVHRGTGKLLVVTENGQADWIDINTGNVIHALSDKGADIDSASVSPDERFAVIGSASGRISCYDLRNGKLLEFDAISPGQTKMLAVDWIRGIVFAGGGSFVNESERWIDTKQYVLHRWQLATDLNPDSEQGRNSDDSFATRNGWLLQVSELLRRRRFDIAAETYLKGAGIYSHHWETHRHVTLGLLVGARTTPALELIANQFLDASLKSLRSEDSLSDSERSSIATTLALGPESHWDDRLMEQTLRQLSESGSQDRRQQHALALIRFRKGQFDLAIDHHAAAMKTRDSNVGQWLDQSWFAILSAKMERLEVAKKALRDTMSYRHRFAGILDSDSAIPSDELPATLELLLMESKFESLLRPLHVLLNWVPNQKASMTRLNKEIDDLTRRLIQTPDEAELYAHRGRLFFQARQSAPGIQDFQTALTLEPVNEFHRAVGGFAALFQGNSNEFDNVVESMLQSGLPEPSRPEESMVYRLLLAHELQADQIASIDAQVRKLVVKYPDDWHVQHVAGLWQIRAGEIKSAAEFLEIAMSLVKPKSLAAYCSRMWRFQIGFQRGKWNELEMKRESDALEEIARTVHRDLGVPTSIWQADLEATLLNLPATKHLSNALSAAARKTTAARNVRITFDFAESFPESTTFNINASAISATGTHAVFAPLQADKLYYLDVESGRMIEFPTGGEIRSLEFSTDEKSLIVGRPNNQIDLVDRKTRRASSINLSSPSRVIGLKRDGTQLAVGFRNNRCSVYDLISGQLRHEPVLLQGRPNELCYSPDGSYLAIAVGNQSIAILTDELDTVSDFSGAERFAWTGENELCLYMSESKELQLLDLTHPEELTKLAEVPTALTAMHHRGEKSQWITANENGVIELWSKVGRLQSIGQIPRANLTRIVSSDDGRFVMVTGVRHRQGDGGSCCTVFDLKHLPAQWTDQVD